MVGWVEGRSLLENRKYKTGNKDLRMGSSIFTTWDRLDRSISLFGCTKSIMHAFPTSIVHPPKSRFWNWNQCGCQTFYFYNQLYVF